MRRIILLSSFFFLTPVVLILTLLFYSFISTQKANFLNVMGKSPKIAYAAIPESSSTMIFKPNAEDARVGAVKDFLSRYKSALAPFSETIVTTADKYGLDYRLLPAIAMQESTLCNNLPKKYKDTFNCWGFGIYGSKVTKFGSFKEAINTVSKTLATKYKAIGLETPEQIMTKYTPSSPNGAWAIGVLGTMEKMSINL